MQYISFTYRIPHPSPANLQVLAVCLLSLCTAGCRPERNWDEMMAKLPPEQRRQMQPMQSVPMVSQGIEKPRLTTAQETTLKGTQEVIGVIIHGRPRAYPLSEMSGTLEHVVNDHVVDAAGNPQAFTVTYCDLTECIRVFQPVADKPSESLEIGTIGLIDGSLALFIGDQRFKQEEDVEQLKDVPHMRTTWDQWKTEHPDTLIYAGVGNTLPSENMISRP